MAHKHKMMICCLNCNKTFETEAFGGEPVHFTCGECGPNNIDEPSNRIFVEEQKQTTINELFEKLVEMDTKLDAVLQYIERLEGSTETEGK